MTAPKRYCVASVTQRDKYLIYAQHDPAEDALIVAKIQRLDKGMGLYNKRGLLKTLRRAREAGMIVLFETRDKKLVKHAPVIVMSDRGDDLRPYRDRYYEYFKSMFEAGELSLPEESEVNIKGLLGMVKESSDPRTGRAVYDFTRAEEMSMLLRSLLVLIAAHVDPPKDLNFFLEVERGMAAPVREGLSKVERMIRAIDAHDRRRLDEMDERIAETQKKWRQNQ